MFVTRVRASLAAMVVSIPLTTGGGGAAMAAQAPDRNPTTHNVSKDNALAIEGYDPVSYFPEGGGSPAKGKESLTHTYGGVAYRFSSQTNLDKFKANPGKYEPAHGGWCSYAMAEKGEKVEVDPKSFVIQDGRLLLFYKSIFSDTRSDWLKDEANLLSKADVNWKKLSGESPRSPAASLQAELDARKSQWEATAKEETKAAYEQGVKEVADLGLTGKSVQVGAVAPEFSLPNADGRTVSLAEMLESGPVVLTWYRGGWCPYCNIQLRAYQEILPEIKELGGTLAAISPETPDNSLSTKQKNELDFYVLSDAGNAVAKKFGIAYKLPNVVSEQFKGRLDIAKYNGDDSEELPLGATYVIAKDGRVAYRFVDSDYRKRAEPEVILDALRRLAKGEK